MVLAFSLCLTAFMILVTITRVAGIKIQGQVDQVWESYFIILGGEIGIILTAITAFRSFFVSRNKRDNNRAKRPPEYRTQWYSRNRYLLKLIFTPSRWRSSSRSQSAYKGYEADECGHFPIENLPDIPRAHMTGVRTFIDRLGERTDPSRIMESQANKESEETWPLDEKNHNPQSQV